MVRWFVRLAERNETRGGEERRVKSRVSSIRSIWGVASTGTTRSKRKVDSLEYERAGQHRLRCWTSGMDELNEVKRSRRNRSRGSARFPLSFNRDESEENVKQTDLGFQAKKGASGLDRWVEKRMNGGRMRTSFDATGRPWRRGGLERRRSG